MIRIVSICSITAVLLVIHLNNICGLEKPIKTDKNQPIIIYNNYGNIDNNFFFSIKQEAAAEIIIYILFELTLVDRERAKKMKSTRTEK